LHYVYNVCWLFLLIGFWKVRIFINEKKNWKVELYLCNSSTCTLQTWVQYCFGHCSSSWFCKGMFWELDLILCSGMWDERLLPTCWGQ
jgi:hypothetical protein